MLTISGGGSRFCDGVSRRSFLRIGALGLGGLTLADLLRAEDRAGAGRVQKSVIMVYLPGGPPHQDFVDLKPDAPSEVRGELKPIDTKVPGIQVCELLPRLAAIMDKLVVIRSIVGSDGGHDDFQCLTGRSMRQRPGNWPSFGSVVSKLLGSTTPALPPFVGLEPVMQHRPYNSSGTGFLGPAHRSFRPNGEAKNDLVLQGITVERLADRRSLLTSLDRLRREADAGALLDGHDAFVRQAYGILTSSRLAEALDYRREDPRVVARYGKGDPSPRGDAAPRLNEQFLVARRLIEAGVRCVTVAYGFWDYHGSNFKLAREDMPMFDQALSALVEDLHQRGLDQDVSVVAWGEFGRTPQINKDAGRDHWPRVSCALLAGGGMRTGQAIGATDRLAGEAVDRPVHFGEVFATLYHNLGLDLDHTTVADLSGRPQYLVDGHKPIAEVI